MKQLKDAPPIIILFERTVVEFVRSCTFNQFLEIDSLDDKKQNAKKLRRLLFIRQNEVRSTFQTQDKKDGN